jgi:hypothetical protein
MIGDGYGDIDVERASAVLCRMVVAGLRVAQELEWIHGKFEPGITPAQYVGAITRTAEEHRECSNPDAEWAAGSWLALTMIERYAVARRRLGCECPAPQLTLVT